MELEHDLDDVLNRAILEYECDIFRSIQYNPRKKIFPGTIFITSLPWLLFGGWVACEEQRGTSKTPWDQSFEESIFRGSLAS